MSIVGRNFEVKDDRGYEAIGGLFASRFRRMQRAQSSMANR